MRERLIFIHPSSYDCYPWSCSCANPGVDSGLTSMADYADKVHFHGFLLRFTLLQLREMVSTALKHSSNNTT